MIQKKNRCLTIGVIGLLSLLVLNSCKYQKESVISNIEESFDNIERIVINGKSLEISYEGRAGEEEVFLNAYLETYGTNGDRINYKVNGKTLIIEYEKEDSWSWFNYDKTGFISVTGPENIKLKATNGSGTMDIANVYSDELDLTISSGKLLARNIGGDNVKVKGSSGSIQLEQVNGSLECQLSSGKAAIKEVNGNLKIKGSSGSVKIDQVEGIVDGSMSSGSMTLENVRELGKLSLSSGRIKAENVGLGKSTELVGSSGMISIRTNSDLDAFNYELTASSGSIKLGNDNKGKKLSIRNGSFPTVRGNIKSGQLTITN